MLETCECEICKRVAVYVIEGLKDVCGCKNAERVSELNERVCVKM